MLQGWDSLGFKLRTKLSNSECKQRGCDGKYSEPTNSALHAKWVRETSKNWGQQKSSQIKIKIGFLVMVVELDEPPWASIFYEELIMIH